jgi:multicomponent K+:H+ antiporter subunit G
MTHAADLPAWAAISTALLLLLGAGLALTGSAGLLRLGSFYERMHAPTLGSTLGVGCILLASMVFFSLLQTRLVIHEALIGIFMTATTPVTLTLLARAALYRDRSEGAPGVPPLVGGAPDQPKPTTEPAPDERRPPQARPGQSA